MRLGGGGAGASSEGSARCLASWPRGGVPLAVDDGARHVARPRGWAAGAWAPSAGGCCCGRWQVMYLAISPIQDMKKVIGFLLSWLSILVHNMCAMFELHTSEYV